MNSNCSENFVFIRNSCLPECPNWVIAGTKTILTDDSFVKMAMILVLVSGVLTILILISIKAQEYVNEVFFFVITAKHFECLHCCLRL